VWSRGAALAAADVALAAAAGYPESSATTIDAVTSVRSTASAAGRKTAREVLLVPLDSTVPRPDRVKKINLNYCWIKT
jgi:hypothetical protein